MKKNRVLFSLFSIILSCILMVNLFSSSYFDEPAQANVRIDGVKSRIYEFSEEIISKFSLPEDTSQPQQATITQKVYLGGFPVGLKLYADGVVIVDTECVDTENGLVDTAKKANLKVGDIIKEINGERVTTNKRVSEIIEQSNGEEISLLVSRDGENLTVNFKTEYSVSEGKFKAGIWIRDSSAGIGTVTFCTEKGYFAALGHAVCDIDTKQVIPISQGETTDVSIVNCIKGKSGCAGELCGYLEAEKTGEVYYNGDLGVYGKFNELPETEIYEVATADEVKTGVATIFATLENGVTEEYEIQITGIDRKSSENKHLVIQVTDKALIEKTGGIIQGMSGSPIIQNGRLVGAVTHVFLNDPTGGYGIFAETMLENVNKLAQ